MKAYYEARAREYDDWYQGLGRFDGLARPRWNEELRELERTLATLSPKRTIDIACGTGFLTRHLCGEITGLDGSPGMLRIARSRLPTATLVEGDALDLPFANDTFERALTGHFYGHLEPQARDRFLHDAKRVAPELVVVDATLRPGREREARQERTLNDGSRWDVYKRYFEPDELAAELGGGEILLAGHWFVVVRTPA